MPGNLPQTTQDRWQTAHIAFTGGITDNTDDLTSAQQNPGALAEGINYEAGLKGGYRRISGYQQFESAAPSGTGPILGVVVFPDVAVLAARSANIYTSPGSGGWVQINTTAPASFTGSINSASFTGVINGADFTASIILTSFNGQIAGNTLTVNSLTQGFVFVGSTLSGTGVTGAPIILSQLTGTPGGAGTYNIGGPSQTVAAVTMSTTGSILDVTAITSGTLVAGQVIKGSGIAGGTAIVSQITGAVGSTGTYLLNLNSFTVGSESMTGNGTTLVTTSVTGTIIIGDTLTGTNIPVGTRIVSQVSGTTGGAGTYTINTVLNIPSESMTSSSTGTTLSVSAVASGTLHVGAVVSGSGISAGTVIIGQDSGTAGGVGQYQISVAQTVASESMTSAYTARSTPNKVRFAHFNFGSEKVLGVDGLNAPFTWDGTTYVQLSQAPTGSLVYEYNNYIFIAKGSLLYFSAPEDESNWSAVDGAGVINVGYPITGLCSWQKTMYILGENRISSLTGTVFGGGSPDAVLSNVSRNVGTVAPDSVTEISGDVLYLSADGIRTISGTTRIGDLEIAAITDPVHDRFLSFINQYASNNFCAVSVRGKNQYRLFASNTGTMSAVSQGWLTCIRGTSYSYTGVTNNWEHFQLEGINAYCADSDYINGVEFVIHGAFNGKVYRQEMGTSFDGDPISHLLRLPYNGYDDPELRKTFYKVKTNIISEGVSNFTLQLSFDYGTATTNQPAPLPIVTTDSSAAFYGSGIYGTSVYNSTGNPEIFNYAIGSGLTMALVYSGNDATSAPFTVRSVVLNYQVNGRR